MNLIAQYEQGYVSKIRVLKMSKTPLVRFSLNEVNFLIAAHSLNFLADVDEGMQIVVAGEYNDRKQFVVKKYSVSGKTKIMIEFEAKKKTPTKGVNTNRKISFEIASNRFYVKSLRLGKQHRYILK